MIVSEVRQYCLDNIEKYPGIANDIRGFWSLFICEIEDDEASIENEAELLYSDVIDLIEEHKKGMKK